MKRWLWMCWVLAACQAGPSEPLDAPPGEAEAERSSVESGAVPADLESIAALLSARHVEDLPSAEQLSRYPSAEASLQQLAQHGETMLIRTRALSLLRHFGSAETGTLLVEIIGDAKAHPALRAAAVTGMGGQPLEERPEQLEIVAAALADQDPRVGLAAVEVLDAFGSGRQALRRAARGELSAEVRAAIESR
jgi:HEAT repeat protein